MRRPAASPEGGIKEISGPRASTDSLLRRSFMDIIGATAPAAGGEAK